MHLNLNRLVETIRALTDAVVHAELTLGRDFYALAFPAQPMSELVRCFGFYKLFSPVRVP